MEKIIKRENGESCQSCYIYVPGIEEAGLFDYREHRICSWCISKWKETEKRAGKSIEWEKLKKGEG